MRNYCPWCGGRPGGCLYCAAAEPDYLPSSTAAGIEPVEDGMTAAVFGRDQADFEAKLASGEIELVAVSKRYRMVLPMPAPAQRPVVQDSRPAKCESHLWAFDVGNFHRRHCTRPGCQARQRFEWQPESLTQQGQWVDEIAAEVSSEPKQPKARKKTAKRATK